MTPGQIAQSAQSRRELASVLLLLLTGTLIYGWIAIGSVTATGFSDSIDYLFLADFYKAWMEGEPSTRATELYRNTRYPPAFPLVLAAFGAGTENQQTAAVVSCAIAILAALAIWLWVRREEAHRPMLGVFVAFALILYPGYFILNLYIVSEPLAMALLALAFWQISKPGESFSTLATAALLIGAATLVRTASAPAIVALLIYLMFAKRHPKRQIALAAALASLPLIAWSSYRSLIGSESYTDYLTLSDIWENLGGWPDILWAPAGKIITALSKNWSFSDSLIIHSVSALLLLFATAGCLLRLKQNQIDAWFLLVYMAMIVVWPFPDELTRFMTFALPFLLVSASSATEALMRIGKTRFDSPHWRRLPAVFGLLFLATALPAAMKYSSRAALPVDGDLRSEKREFAFFLADSSEAALNSAEMIARTRFLSNELADHIPAGECVYTIIPQVVRLHGKVRAFAYPDDLRTTAEAHRRLRQCNYYMVVGLTAVQLNTPPLYPYPLIQDWTETVLVSDMSNGQRSSTAAALLRRIPDSPQNSAEPPPRMEGPVHPEPPARLK